MDLQSTPFAGHCEDRDVRSSASTWIRIVYSTWVLGMTVRNCLCLLRIVPIATDDLGEDPRVRNAEAAMPFLWSDIETQ